MKWNNIIPLVERIGVTDSRILFIPANDKLFVGLNITIEEQGIKPGIGVVFNDVAEYDIVDKHIVLELKEAIENAGDGILFECSERTNKDNIYIVLAYPNSVLRVVAKSLKILESNLRVR